MRASLASDGTTTEDQHGSDPAPTGPRECMPCSGSGSVISNLGGEPKSMTCPWCAGTGERQEGIDAQAGWPSEGQAASAEQGQSVPEASGDEQAASAEQGQSVPEASGDSPSGDSADR